MMACFSMLSSCEPCADCGEPLLFDPNVTMTFINRDSLLSINDSLEITTDSISNMDDFLDSLDSKVSEWNSLIDAFTDSIEDGKTEYIADTLKIYDSLILALTQTQLYDTALLRTEEIEDYLTDIQSIILSGSVLVDYVEIFENGSLLEYEDSAESYSVPLLMQGYDFTTFIIKIEEKIDTISFSYTTELFTDTERKVEMRAYNIDTLGYTYDSLIFECNTSECLSNEVSVTTYF